ncbi:MAG: serine--tRNA ligase [Planctomycetes bacterium]|nr:serine--tRNA ligase [Planctomycetota bacterium]
MIDAKLFRDDPDFLREACRLKHWPVDIDKCVALDSRRRALIVELENLQAKRNSVSKEIAVMKKEGRDASATMEEMRAVGERIKALTDEKAAIEPQLRDLTLSIPNHPAPDVPEGNGEEDNVVVAEWGEKRQFNFQPKPHWELCEALDIIDWKRGVKLSGSGFILYKGLGARLERALFNFFLDLHTEEQGYTEWFPPFLVNRDSMIGTGQLPKMENDMYHCDKEDDLFLIPTAEVPVTNIHRDEMLNKDDLPLYYTAYSACFRREAGSAGKDTRGLLRVHEFNKVEMVKFTRPETSYDELEKLRADADACLRRLNLPYRTLKLCSADLSFSAAKCYDFEAYAPGVDKYLEVSSCSNFEDFQARRANIRFKDDEGKTRFVHTLNSSGLALPRTMIAIIENNQQEDGSVVVPEALRKYMGCDVIRRK